MRWLEVTTTCWNFYVKYFHKIMLRLLCALEKCYTSIFWIFHRISKAFEGPQEIYTAEKNYWNLYFAYFIFYKLLFWLVKRVVRSDYHGVFSIYLYGMAVAGGLHEWINTYYVEMISYPKKFLASQKAQILSHLRKLTG